jgi:methionyl-tRNA synthetase
MKKLYITTPIFYTSGNLHVGHCLTTLWADVVSRWYRQNKVEVYFLTGSDEHGQKVQQKAIEANMNEQDYVDKVVVKFIDLWKKLRITNNQFIRTTDKLHMKFVQECFEKLLQDNEIYLSKWVGYYCTQCEENYSDKQLIIGEDGKSKCKIGHYLDKREEESYFLNVKKHHKWLSGYLSNENTSIPEETKRELTNNFINHIEDLSITRTTTTWGIKVPSNPKHTIYVWFDALLNYVSAVKALDKDNEKFWRDDVNKVHLLGKEISRFHCIYWPLVLHMLDLPLPNKYLVHGWLIDSNENKMSKSLGNVIDPNVIIETYGIDTLRYYLSTKMLERDSAISYDLIKEKYNSFLANSYGNLINRVTGMINKYFNGIVPNVESINDEFIKQVEIVSYKFESMEVSRAVEIIELMVSKINKEIDEVKPWELYKKQKTVELSSEVSSWFNRTISIVNLLRPILVESYERVSVYLHDEVREKIEINLIKGKKIKVEPLTLFLRK